jgi:hypothetical protein
VRSPPFSSPPPPPPQPLVADLAPRGAARHTPPEATASPSTTMRNDGKRPRGTGRDPGNRQRPGEPGFSRALLVPRAIYRVRGRRRRPRARSSTSSPTQRCSSEGSYAPTACELPGSGGDHLALVHGEDRGPHAGTRRAHRVARREHARGDRSTPSRARDAAQARSSTASAGRECAKVARKSSLDSRGFQDVRAERARRAGRAASRMVERKTAWVRIRVM